MANFDFDDPTHISSAMYSLPPSADAQSNHQPTAPSLFDVMYNLPPNPSSPSLQTHGNTDRRRASPLFDSDADQLPSRTVREKRHIEDGYDEGPSTKRRRQTSATELPTYDGSSRLLDLLTGPVMPPAAIPGGRQLSNKTQMHTNVQYKTVGFEEEEPRDQPSLVTIPSANSGTSSQRSPDRPAKSSSDATAGQKPKSAGRGKSTKTASSSAKDIACTWPVCIAPGDKMCHERFGRKRDMLRHIRTKHLCIPLKCHVCGKYVLRDMKAHQSREICSNNEGNSQAAKDKRGSDALQTMDKAMGVLNGDELSHADDIQSLVEAIRQLVNAGYSQSTDIEDCIDWWMRENGWVERGWQRIAELRVIYVVSS